MKVSPTATYSSCLVIIITQYVQTITRAAAVGWMALWKARNDLAPVPTGYLCALRQPQKPRTVVHSVVACETYVTRSHNKGSKSLGPIRATGKEVRDNHYGIVLHLTPTLQLAITFLSF